MEVKIFKWANVVAHCEGNKIMRRAFQDFYDKLEYCDWNTPNDIKKTFASADVVSCEGAPFNRVIFDIGGNKYRLICGYLFKNKVMLYIRFIGTHAEYDKINVCSVNMF